MKRKRGCGWLGGRGSGTQQAYMPSKISSSCLGPTGRCGMFARTLVCTCLRVCALLSGVGVHGDMRGWNAASVGAVGF